MSVRLFGHLSRYIFARTLTGVAIAAAAVALSVVLVDLVEQSRAVSAMPGGSTGLAVQLVLMRLPGIMEQAVPFAVLVGTVMGFLSLSRSSEIVAMRAAGVSAWHFLTPPAVLAFLIGLVVVLGMGPAAAVLNDSYTDLRDRLETSRAAEGPGTGAGLVWRAMQVEGGAVVVSGTPDPADPQSITGATFSIIPTDASAGDRRIDAARASLGADGVWQLTDATESRPGFRSVRYPLLQLTTVDAEQARAGGLRDPRDLPVWALPETAARAEAAGSSPGRYWLRFHRQLALPVTLVAMAVMAALLSLGVARLGGQARLTGMALAAGLGVFFAGDGAAALATAGLVPAWAGAWTVPLVALLVAVAAVSYREDG
jgi:lipopolysaccharide export system permease protein